MPTFGWSLSGFLLSVKLVCMCVYLCLPPRSLITRGMMWHDMNLPFGLTNAPAIFKHFDGMYLRRAG